MPIFILTVLIQVAFVVHIMKTGRSTTWIWVVVMLPVAGSIAYFILEVLPELMQSSTGQKTRRKAEKIINPDKELKQALYDYSITETVDNAKRLAEAYVNKGKFEKARELYKKCLKGLHSHDPYLMHRYASVCFELKQFNEVKQVLDELIAKNPDYKDADAHLLYAKVLEELGETGVALEELLVLDGYYPGLEATYRYAMLLKKTGETKSASDLIKKILRKSKISSKHYNSINKEWVDKSRKELLSE